MKKIPADRPLVLCYISGLDLRWVNSGTTPFLAAQLGQSPFTTLVNLPSNELFPTLVTGVDPTVHGVWGVKLHPDIDERLQKRTVDLLPDVLTTAAQCILHRVRGIYDLAAVPPARRRRFAITRTKYKRRNQRPEALYEINSVETILGMVGRDASNYVFSSSPNPGEDVLDAMCRPDKVLEILELYSLDRFQQWWLHDRARVAQMYARVDQFLQRLKDKCDGSGKLLMIISDHGHQKIKGSIDLNERLRQLDIGDDEYTHFLEVSNVRFWFHSERARKQILILLDKIDHGTVIQYQEMHQYGLPLSDTSYGEVFCYLDPGYIFFPHDFNQPLANWYFGLTDSMQRSRLFDARHRGNHGHLPHFEAEKSFVLLASNEFAAQQGKRGTLLDVAPSILSLIGRPVPPQMSGHPLFHPGPSRPGV